MTHTEDLNWRISVSDSGEFRRAPSHRLFAQITRILDINNLSTITTEVVDTARQNLVIGLP